MVSHVRRFKSKEKHPFTANEMKVAGLLLTTRGRGYTTEEVAFYAGVHAAQVSLIMERLRNKGIDVCTESDDEGGFIHSAPHNKLWHFAIGAALISFMVYLLFLGLTGTP